MSERFVVKLFKGVTSKGDSSHMPSAKAGEEGVNGNH